MFLSYLEENRPLAKIRIPLMSSPDFINLIFKFNQDLHKLLRRAIHLSNSCSRFGSHIYLVLLVNGQPCQYFVYLFFPFWAELAYICCDPNVQQDIIGLWAQDLHSSTCVAVNHRYRLIAYGCTKWELFFFYNKLIDNSLTACVNVPLN